MKRSVLISGIGAGFMLSISVAAPASAGPVQIIPWEDSYTVVHAVGEDGWCPPDVVDNGDGTLTIHFKDARSTKVRLAGTSLFQNTGLVEGAVIFDHSGTPADPDDDEFIEVDGQIGFHGRFDTEDRDFCEDIATYLGD